MKAVSHYISNSGSRNMILNNSVSGSDENVTDEYSFLYHQKRNQIQKRLKYFFMNPIDKWKTKGRFPYKLALQIIKIIFVTMQVFVIGKEKGQLLSHQNNMMITFRELFLKDWDPAREVVTYPPPTGPYAVYTKNDFYSTIDYAIKAYSNITLNGLGSFGHTEKVNKVSPIFINFTEFSSGHNFPFNFSYTYDFQKVTKSQVIDVNFPPGDQYWENFSIEKMLKNKHNEINFDTLLSFTLQFDIRTIYMSNIEYKSQPICYQIRVLINFDNNLHDGQIPISLDGKSYLKPCHGNINNTTFIFPLNLVLIIMVIILCLTSLALCLRSFVNGLLLRKETCAFFQEYYALKISFKEQIVFVDFWIVVILCNDILLIFGSVFKFHNYQNNRTLLYLDWEVLFGLNILLVYIGILRYLSFFSKYNVIILAVKGAVPDILRFTLCAGIIYR